MGHVISIRTERQFHIRPYCSGDEIAIVELWQRCYAGFAGYILRTAERWTHSILRRPGVTADGVFVLESDGQLAAFAVLDGSGQVIEFAVDTILTPVNRKRACKLLIDSLESRAAERGHSELVFYGPRSDTLIHKALLKAGYDSESIQTMSVGILDARQLIESILLTRAAQFPRDWSFNCAINLSPGNYRIAQHTRLYVGIEARSVSVRDQTLSEPSQAECRIDIDMCTLTELIFSRGGFMAARNEQRIVIAPQHDESNVRRLFEYLSLQFPWFSPKSDDF